MRLTLALLAAPLVLSAQTLAIRNVTIIDADGARPNSTVLLSAGRITGAGTRAAVPARVTVIDGAGKYLIPGLWDMHVHLWEKDPMANLYVANGILGIRDMGSDLARTRKLRADIQSGKILGPAIYTPGPVLDGPDSEMKQAPVLKLATPEDARRAVDSVEKSSADFVGILSSLSADAYQSVAQRARVIRMPFAGHLPESVTAAEAIDARQKSIEHLFGIAVACSPLETTLRAQRAEAIAKKDYAALRAVRKRTYETFSPRIANDLFHRMARFGVWQTPTLTMWQRVSLINPDRLASAPELNYLPAGIRSGWADPRETARRATDEQRANFREDYEFHSKLVKFIQGSGVDLLAGSDTGDSFVVPGFALHDELEALVGAGLSPQEALNAATISPARYFGIEGMEGTIARGKKANLVLLDANPLADIRNTRRISAVIANGRLLNRRCLDALLAGKQTQCPSISPTAQPEVPSVPRRGSSRKLASRTH